MPLSEETVTLSVEETNVLNAVRTLQGVGDIFWGQQLDPAKGFATLVDATYPGRSLPYITGMSNQKLTPVLKRLVQYGCLTRTTRKLSFSSPPCPSWALTSDGEDALTYVPFLPVAPTTDATPGAPDCETKVRSVLYEQLHECVAQTWALATMFEPQFHTFYAGQYPSTPKKYTYDTVHEARNAWKKQLLYTLQLSDRFDTSAVGQQIGTSAAKVSSKLAAAQGGGGLDTEQYRAIFELLGHINGVLAAEELQDAFQMLGDMFANILPKH